MRRHLQRVEQERWDALQAAIAESQQRDREDFAAGRMKPEDLVWFKPDYVKALVLEWPNDYVWKPDARERRKRVRREK